jgi:hypothetical protein
MVSSSINDTLRIGPGVIRVETLLLVVTVAFQASAGDSPSRIYLDHELTRRTGDVDTDNGAFPHSPNLPATRDR